MKRINDYLRYIPASEEPLSADVYVIDGNQYCYVYDVGNNETARNALNSISKEKVVILSHYHKDHTGNVGKIDYGALYVGDLTYQTLGKGQAIDGKLMIEDGVRIEIQSCPSPHTEGSLIVTLNQEYTLIGDLYFTRTAENNQKAVEMLKTLASIETKYFVVSHQEENAIFEKQVFLEELNAYFGT